MAIIPYTSGTTGFPKGVILTHQNLILNGLNMMKVDPWHENDRIMAYLPMAWIGDTFFSVVLSFLSGAQVNCPEEVTTVQKDLREIAPTQTFAPPRIWENMVTQVQVKLEDSDWLKRKLANFFIPLGIKVAEMEVKRERIPWYLKVLHQIGDWLVYGMLRDHLGLRHIRVATTGGAALGPEVFLFFRGLGVNLKQLYGLTESSAPVTLQRDGDVKVDTVGPPIPDVELKITEKGEVLIKGPGVFKGYYKNPEATAESLRDGWLATGDAAFFDPDGHLAIIDRAKDVSHLLDGSVFAPQYLENKLKFSPYIKEAVAIGEKRPFVTAMINIDIGSVGNWAERRAIPYTGYPDLSQKPEVYDLIHNEVVKVNRTLPRELWIKKYVVLHKELDPDDAEITRTRKLRRGFIAQKYANIIQALYGEGEQVGVKALITYEDGRTAEVERILRIRGVGETLIPLARPK
jgi:long-chain acyl-CoA synthetase